MHKQVWGIVVSAVVAVGCGSGDDGAIFADARPVHDALIAQTDATPAVVYSLRVFGSGEAGVDRVQVSLDPHVPADVGATDMTIEFWFKAAPGENTHTTCSFGIGSWQSGNVILDRAMKNVAGHSDWGIAYFADGFGFGARKGPVGSGNTACVLVPLEENEWHHVAISYEVAFGDMAIYVDGVFQGGAQASGLAGDISYQNDLVGDPLDPALVLGASKFDPDGTHGFSGWIDELRLSTTVRYTEPFSPPTAPFSPDADTAALYHFDEGVGTDIHDSATALGGPSAGVLIPRVALPNDHFSTDTPFSEGDQ